jgi:hypothetical protein
MERAVITTEAITERHIQAVLKKRIVSLGPLLLLKDDNDVFAREQQIRELGWYAVIYSTWDYGFAKEGETKPSFLIRFSRTLRPQVHA